MNIITKLFITLLRTPIAQFLIVAMFLAALIMVPIAIVNGIYTALWPTDTTTVTTTTEGTEKEFVDILANLPPVNQPTVVLNQIISKPRIEDYTDIRVAKTITLLQVPPGTRISTQNPLVYKTIEIARQLIKSEQGLDRPAYWDVNGIKLEDEATLDIATMVEYGNNAFCKVVFITPILTPTQRELYSAAAVKNQFDISQQ